MDDEINEDEFAEVVKQEIASIGSQHKASFEWGMNQPEISKWLRSRDEPAKGEVRPPKKIIEALGYQEVRYITRAYIKKMPQ